VLDVSRDRAQVRDGRARPTGYLLDPALRMSA
jgi:hypothetical protein